MRSEREGRRRGVGKGEKQEGGNGEVRGEKERPLKRWMR